MSEKTDGRAEPEACCAERRDLPAGCECCEPKSQDRSWLKLLITGVILLAAFWLAIRSLVAKPEASRVSSAAVASASSGGTPALPANLGPGNQAQPSCCGGGNAPPASPDSQPKCGDSKPSCCGH